MELFLNIVLRALGSLMTEDKEGKCAGDVNAEKNIEGPIDPDNPEYFMPKMTNEEDLGKMYGLLGHELETELVLRDIRGELPQMVMFVHSIDEFLQICKFYEWSRNIFVGLNEREQWGTGLHSVVRVDAIMVHIDPIWRQGRMTMDSHLRAHEVAIEILDFLRKSGCTPSIANSGNGYHIYLRVRIPLTGNNREGVQTAIAKFQRSIALRFYDGVRAWIDVNSDLAVLGRAIGSPNWTSNGLKVNISNWLAEPNPNVDKRLSAEIIADARAGAKTMTAEAPAPDLEESSEKAMWHWIERLDEKGRDLFEGRWENYSYRSRREGEMALACRMACLGVPKRVAWWIMADASIGRWNQMGPAYQERMMAQAYGLTASFRDGVE